MKRTARFYPGFKFWQALAFVQEDLDSLWDRSDRGLIDERIERALDDLSIAIQRVQSMARTDDQFERYIPSNAEEV